MKTYKTFIKENWKDEEKKKFYDEEMEESSINEKFEIERDARKYKKGDKVEVALVGKRRKEVWVPGVVDGFEMKPGNRKYLEITYTKTMEMRKER